MRCRDLLVPLGVASLLTLAASAAAPRHAEFEKMLTLAGEWVGKTDRGFRTTATYKAISEGSALMETLRIEKGPEMVTIYHPYGEHLMLTHYCSSKTQPRMRTEKSSPNLAELRFNFLDATNIMNSSDTAMHNLVVRFRDPAHFQQEWRSESPDDSPVIIDYTRKESPHRH